MVSFFPVVGGTYVIREWDETRNNVKVIRVSRGLNRIVFQYPDGLIHQVTADYFAFELNATGARS